MSMKQRWYKFKPLPQDIRARLDRLHRLFHQEGVLLAYLFGSLAEKDSGDDVDLAVLPGKENLADLREKVWDALGTQRLDLVNLRSASPLLRFQVVKNGRLLYKRSEDIENTFELATLREYKDTAYMRKRQAKILEERIKNGYKA